MVHHKYIGILLAGGKSSRYGSPKAFAKLDGKMFYEIAYEHLKKICDHVIIVTRKEFIEKFPKDYHVITDLDAFSGCGPLAGIYSAMTAAEADHYVVLPCDMPLLNHFILQQLLNRHVKDVAVVVSEGYLQPLVSVWDRKVKSIARIFLESGQFKMTSLLDHLNVVPVDGNILAPSSYVFMNINTLEEDKEMRKWKESQIN